MNARSCGASCASLMITICAVAARRAISRTGSIGTPSRNVGSHAVAGRVGAKSSRPTMDKNCARRPASGVGAPTAGATMSNTKSGSGGPRSGTVVAGSVAHPEITHSDKRIERYLFTASLPFGWLELRQYVRKFASATTDTLVRVCAWFQTATAHSRVALKFFVREPSALLVDLPLLGTQV